MGGRLVRALRWLGRRRPPRARGCGARTAVSLRRGSAGRGGGVMAAKERGGVDTVRAATASTRLGHSPTMAR